MKSELARAACVICHRAKCALLTAFFSLSLPAVTFLTEGVIVRFRNLYGVLSLTKNEIWGKQKFGGPPMAPEGAIF